jgi:hypothetical protein
MKRGHLPYICLFLLICSVTGCAVVRDPMPPNEIVFAGWGKVSVVHTREKDSETYVFEREINTSEILVEISGLIGAVASALALCL